ncbi:MAG: class I SAM-dependent methyltransferase [Xanthobacteraceae bacterium]
MTRPQPIILAAPASPENFDERAYLTENHDVAKAVADGQFTSAWEHYLKHGKKEGRRQRLTAAVDHARAAKLQRLRPWLRADMQHAETDGRLNFLTAELLTQAAIEHADYISSNSYDERMLGLIEKHQGGLILDCGAGRRDVYYPDVINYEVQPYDTTDVLGVGEDLPFKDETFDAVFSIAVLEHVRDPFRCATEIARVMKPRADLYCCIPFLQPLHGFPNHYFNATVQGARRLFEDRLIIESVSVPDALHPIWALHWIIKSWSEGLDEEARTVFQQARIRDFLSAPSDLLKKPYAARLSAAKRVELAIGTVLIARKG